MELIDAIRSDKAIDEKTREIAYALAAPVELDDLPGRNTGDIVERIKLWETLREEATREHAKLARVFNCSAPIRTADAARRGAEAWSGYLEKFASTLYQIPAATLYRDWFRSWLSDEMISIPGQWNC